MKRSSPLPVIVTFDLSRPRPNELNRIRSMFERLGWERLGNTAYRYPALGQQPVTEDWFNCVMPALMMLGAYSRFAATEGRGLIRFTIDAQSMTGFNQEANVGSPPRSGAEAEYAQPSPAARAFAEQRLRDWLDGIEWPYAPEEQEDAGP
jgi:hypothetical protein